MNWFGYRQLLQSQKKIENIFLILKITALEDNAGNVSPKGPMFVMGKM